MSKEQKRGNREVKKPKQDKPAPKPDQPFRNQVGLSAIKDNKDLNGKARRP
jgi:hypothetical protein